MGHIEVVDRDVLTEEFQVPVIDRPVQQLEAHECPEIIDLIKLVIANLGDMGIRPIYGFPLISR